MPFTLSHPAAAVPFTKYGWPLSALVVGSMAPDFPYFIHFSTRYQYGHTFSGLFWFCLPAGLVVLWLFHNLLKLPLLSLLPAKHQERLMSIKTFRFGPAHRFLLILSALLLGAVTHIVWDSFTHAGGWSVERWPILRAPLLQTSHGALFVFKILQHGSTLSGAVLMIIWYRRWFKLTAAQPIELPIHIPESLKSRLICFIFALAVLIAGIYGFLQTSTAFTLQALIRRFVIASVTTVLLELIIYSLIWQFNALRQRPD